MNNIPHHAASQIIEPAIEAPDNTLGPFPELAEVTPQVPHGPYAPPVDQIHSGRSNRRAALVGGAMMGALSVPTAAGYICDQARNKTLEKALACSTSAPSVLWGGALLRQAPSLVSAPLAYRWPQTLYVTHRAEKYADVLAALYGMLLDNIPWDNERALIGRLPGQEFPSSCNPRMPLPHCPDVLAWDRAAHIAPYVEGLICVVTGAVVGAFLGAVIWRDGVHAIAKVPVRYIPEADWTFEQIFVDMNKRAMMRAAFSGFRVLVVAAQEEVRQRQADPQGPEPDEHTPLLAQPEGNGPVNV